MYTENVILKMQVNIPYINFIFYSVKFKYVQFYRTFFWDLFIWLYKKLSSSSVDDVLQTNDACVSGCEW